MDAVTLALAKKYVDDTLAGIGSLKGAPAQIQSIERDPTGGGSNITFYWEDSAGGSHTDVLFVPDGAEGPRGKSAAQQLDSGEIRLSVNDEGHLILSYDA